MTNLKKWVYLSSYIGENYSDYYMGCGQSRDSDALERSNFAAAIEMLGGENETVIVARAGHWACGWVEQILVHESDKKALQILSDIKTKLEDYPVLDDDAFSQLEYDELNESFESNKEYFIQSVSEYLGIEKLPKKAVEIFVNEAHQSSASYQGYAQAWVSCDDSSWDYFVESYEFKQLIKDKNKVALLVAKKLVNMGVTI
jgi:hypothetical protein